MEKETLELIQEYLTRNNQILLAYLFGSRAVGKPGPISDYDFGFLVRSASAETHLRLGYDLVRILKTDQVDVVFLNQAPIELAYVIISQGQVIYQVNLAIRVETEAQIMSCYGDYLPILRAQRQDIVRGGDYEAGIQRYRTAFRRTERTLAALRTPQK